MESFFDYTTTENGVRITGYHGNAVHVQIPETIGGLPVYAIGTHTFQEDGLFIETISVPGTVRVIEPYAFELCLSLTRLELAEGLERIGEGALQATALEEVVVPSTVTQIDGIGACTCDLEFAPGNTVYSSDGFGVYRDQILVSTNKKRVPRSFRIREGTTAVAGSLFEDCVGLEEVILPASLTQLPEGLLANVKDPFSRDRSISKVSVDVHNPVFFVEQDILYQKETAGAEKSGSPEGPVVYRLIRNLCRKTQIEIPDGVTHICREAFLRTDVRKVTIPVSVREIGADAFLETPLEEAVLLRPDGGSDCIYFPQSDSFLLKNLLRGFGKNGRRYDFTTYDEVLADRHLNLARVRMSCSRLENGIDLPEGKHALLWASVLGRMEEIVRKIAAENEIDLLKRLAAHGFITESNIDRLIRAAGDGPGETVGRVRLDGQLRRPDARGTGQQSIRKEAMAWLMDYKHVHFAKKEFDFSL